MATVASPRARLADGLKPYRAALLVAIVGSLGGLAVSAVAARSSTPPAVWLLAGPALALLGFIVTRGPLVCLAGLVIVDVVGLYQVSLVSAGSVEIRLIDIFWVGLVGWMIAIRMRDGVQPGRNVGQRALAVWLIA